MAVVQWENGTATPVATDTSHVFDADGNPLEGQLFLGEEIAQKQLPEIDPYAHESEVQQLSQSLTELVTLDSFSGTTGTGANAGLLTIPKSSYPNVTMIVPCGLSDNAAYSCHYWSQSATNFNIMVKSVTSTSWASGVSVTFTALVYKLPSA